MGKDQTIAVGGVEPTAIVGTPTVWLHYRWAPSWFSDALAEARRTTSRDEIRHARRREVLFAVCFAESYLFEWVLVDVLERDFKALETVFPHNQKQGIRDKWKDVTKLLFDTGRIPRLPTTGDRHSQDWTRLIDYRDGLVHAVASRPASASLQPNQGPVPDVTDLDNLPAGWALRVAREQVRRLHEAAGTVMPYWLSESF